jgi:hypothetical protein
MLARSGRRLVALLAFSLLPSTGRAVEWRLLSESADGLRLRLEVSVPPPERIETTVDGQPFTRFVVPGTRPDGAPGAPELLVATQLLAVPPGTQATVQVVERDEADLGTLRLAPRPQLRVRYGPRDSAADPSTGFPEEVLIYDPKLYVAGGAHTDPVMLGSVGALRHLSVLPVQVWPLLYDPATAHLRLVRRLVLDIQLRRTARTAEDPASAPQALLATPRTWQQVYGAAVLNPQDVVHSLRAPRRDEMLGKPLRSGLLRPGLRQEDEWRLRVGSTGPVRVRASDLLAAGLPDGMRIDQLRLVLKRYDPAAPLEPRILEIPILVQDADGDGFFRSGDSFIFYAEHPRDDTTAGEPAARYSFTNVYWLSLTETGTPARIPVRPRLAATTPGPTTFAQEITTEEDLVPNLWVYSDDAELYFMVDRVRAGSEARYTVPVPGRDSASPLEVCVDTQQDWLRRAFTAWARFSTGPDRVLGSSPGAPAPPQDFSPPPRIQVCGTVAAADVVPGNVTVVLKADPVVEFPFDFLDTTPFLDNVRLRYTAQYLAAGDRVRCTSGGATGPTEFTITGFSSGASLVALDITDPKSPAAFDLQGALSGGTLRLTDDIPAGATHSYLVAPSGGIPALAASAIERDTPDPFGPPILSELGTPGSFGLYDVLVVAHDSFAGDAKLAEWKAQREAGGHRVRIVRTSDAYDAFDGGLLHYEAIYRLVQEAYRNWGISAVVLVGDGSEDAAGLDPLSGPNFVPARVKYFAVQASSGGGWEYRNDMNDRYYAKMDGPADFYPDILLGRLPVSNAQELRNVVDKIHLYENPVAGDDSKWRKRVLLFSDDEWVRRIRSPNPFSEHMRGCAEWDFYRSVRRCCDTVKRAFPGDLVCVPFYLHLYSNQLADQIPEHAAWPIETQAPACDDTLGYVRPHPSPLSETIFYDRVSRALADSVGAGCLFFALQSHAARNVVADESIMLQHDPPVPDFYNNGKPFVFFGFGCHLNEYGVFAENGGGRSAGDALGETYVTLPERGAVASYASTGFEYLDENNTFHENMWRAIFEKRFFNGLGGTPVNPDTLAADWLLAALLQVAEISNGNTNIIDRFALLGDPLLRLDAGVPRFQVAQPTNGFLDPDGRIGPIDPSQPVGFSFTINDEQGIDSLWVEKRFTGGGREAVAPLTITANVDTAAQIVAKRSYTIKFSILFTECNFELAVGGRDLARRKSEFIGRASFEGGGQFGETLAANGIPVQAGDRVDGRTAFRYAYESCAPRANFDLTVLLDGQPLFISAFGSDSLKVRWTADFAWDVGPGQHQLQFGLDGSTISSVQLQVGGTLGLHDVVAFPNPFADWTRVFFRLDEQISGGFLRIMDLNGRLVRQFDLAQPGVVQIYSGVQPAKVGSAQTDVMNYVEWDGADNAGDRVANGIYLFELRIQDDAGHALRKLDKVVVMR